MSDPIDRSVPLPPPRPERPLSLIKTNRAPPTEPASAEPTPEPSRTEAPTAWPAFANATGTLEAAAVAPVVQAPILTMPTAAVERPLDASGVPTPAIERISFDLPADLRQRVRAAFKATRNDEDDESFGDMMRKIVAAECERREAVYNGGQRYSGDSRPLRAGRPIV
jgi:hypothetical protein